MSEWKDSYESRDDHLKDLAARDAEHLKLFRTSVENEEAAKERQFTMQRLNLGICIYRDFGRDQDKWPAWIKAQAAELGIE